ncbi:MAG: FHA domain-containing protein [Proteobacteria bacterium]|nr:FHA domain-containing protein [Pseudomonadota bacterium]
MPKLLLMDAAGHIRQISLAHSTISLGRSPGSDVVLDSKRASREHALIEVDGPKVVIVDMHSLNGTLVNGELIDRHQLAHGDSIEIGTVEMRYVALDQVLSEDEALRLLTAPSLQASTQLDGWDDWDYDTERDVPKEPLLRRHHHH